MHTPWTGPEARDGIKAIELGLRCCYRTGRRGCRNRNPFTGFAFMSTAMAMAMAMALRAEITATLEDSELLLRGHSVLSLYVGSV